MCTDRGVACMIYLYIRYIYGIYIVVYMAFDCGELIELMVVVGGGGAWDEHTSPAARNQRVKNM